MSKEQEEDFKTLCKNGKVLWILDGYDEFAQNIPTQLNDIFNHIRKTQHHILTSRPYAVALSYEVKMEIIGFTDDNITKYVKLFFEQINENTSNGLVETNKIMQFLKSNPSIWGVAHIPVNLELICTAWNNTDWSKTRILTLTILYDNMVEWLCRRHLTKPSTECKYFADMEKDDVLQECEPELKFLEHLAFEAMKSHIILLPKELLSEIKAELKYSSKKYQSTLNFGVLKLYHDTATGRTNPGEHQHYFVHLSFQEHFAARQLINLLKSSEKQKAIEFIKQNKYDQRFRLLFIFASGLLVKRHNQSAMSLFWANIQGEPLDIVGISHIKLIIEILNEVLEQTVFKERTEYLKLISRWIIISAAHNADAVSINLAESLERAPGVLNSTYIQHTILRLLKTHDSPIRTKTLGKITNFRFSEPSEKLITALLDAMDDEDWDVRRSACEAIGKMGEKAVTKEVITALLNARYDEDWDVRRSAHTAIGKMGEKAVTNEVITALLNAMHDENRHVRRNACETIGEIGKLAVTSEVITTMVNAMRDEDRDVRKNACAAIGKMGEKAVTNEVITALLNAMHDEDPYARRHACYAIGNIGEKAATNEVITALLNMMRDEDGDVRRYTCYAIGNMGEKAVTNELIAALLNMMRDEPQYVRRSACEAIGKMGEKAATNEVIAALLNMMRDEDGDVRQKACDAIGEMGEKAATNEAITALLNAMRDENKDVRQKACSAIANMGEKAASNEVITAMLNAMRGKDEAVQPCACRAIGNIGEKAVTNEVIAVLLNTMRDENHIVRSNACDAIGKMGEKAATNEVITALLDAAPVVDRYNRRDSVVLIICKIVSSTKAIRDWSTEVICGVFERVRSEPYIRLGEMNPNQLLDAYVDSGNDSWLSFAAYAALIQSIAVTIVGDEITVFKSNEVMKLDMSRPELRNRLLEVFMEEKKRLEELVLTIPELESDGFK